MKQSDQTAGTMQEEFERYKKNKELQEKINKANEEIKQQKVFENLEDDLDNPKIDNPTHYQSMVAGLNIDAITCMRAAFGDNDVKAFCLCNSLKYIYRSSSKGQNTDIGKAIWYLNKFLELGGYE